MLRFFKNGTSRPVNNTLRVIKRTCHSDKEPKNLDDKFNAALVTGLGLIFFAEGCEKYGASPQEKVKNAGPRPS